MIILKLIVGFFGGLYGLYLLIGLAILLPEILWAVGVVLGSPFKQRRLPDGELDAEPNMWQRLQEVPQFITECVMASYHWIISPFLVVKYIIFPPQEKQPGE